MNNTKKSSWLAIASLVCTIIWIVLTISLIWIIIGIPLLIIWFILWVIAIFKKQKLWMSITSTILSWIILTLIIWLITILSSVLEPIKWFIFDIESKIQSDSELQVLLQQDEFSEALSNNIETSMMIFFINPENIENITVEKWISIFFSKIIEELDNTKEQWTNNIWNSEIIIWNTQNITKINIQNKSYEDFQNQCKIEEGILIDEDECLVWYELRELENAKGIENNKSDVTKKNVYNITKTEFKNQCSQENWILISDEKCLIGYELRELED